MAEDYAAGVDGLREVGSQSSSIATPIGTSRGTSQWQQSLQREHFEQRWLEQESLVQYTQMRSDTSAQMVQ